MSVSPAILLISLTIGIPLMLLALGVLYYAYLYSRQPLVAGSVGDALSDHVDHLVTESADELLVALQDAVDDMQEQLAQQREALAGMLSEPRPAFATVAPLSLEDDHPMAAGDFVGSSAEVERRGVVERPGITVDLRGRIARLASDGLSDRAIARELHIGLEEVRIARMRGSRS